MQEGFCLLRVTGVSYIQLEMTQFAVQFEVSKMSYKGSYEFNEQQGREDARKAHERGNDSWVDQERYSDKDGYAYEKGIDAEREQIKQDEFREDYIRARDSSFDGSSYTGSSLSGCAGLLGGALLLVTVMSISSSIQQPSVPFGSSFGEVLTIRLAGALNGL